ncbi:MAG: aspartate aminotransferase family protein, partial [SAR202 cluster bacterium]|nr:aspartate aminotransferase family protein [SAR202 cluster bacterium]
MAIDTRTGEDLENLKDMAAAHFWPHSRQAGDLSDDTGITLVGDANGVWVEDLKGVKWFDTIAGMWLKNIGHGRNEIAEAVYKQMTQVSYSPGGTVSPATVELSGKLASLTPDKDSRIYFVSGGSEAVETALKMAKKYHSNNGQSRWKVISRRGSYHGATHACISLGGGGVGAPGDYGP